MIFKKAMIGAVMSLFTAGATFAAPLTIPTDVNLRWGPGLEYPVQLVVPEGTVVDVQRCADFWCEVSFDEYQGFMNRDVIGLGDIGPLPATGPFSQGPQPIFVPAFEDYYYDDDYGYAYGPGFGFRYYGGFHGRFNSRQARHSRQESGQRIHRTIVSRLSVHNPAVSSQAGHNRARSSSFTHSRGESAQLRGNRDLLKQRLQNQQNVIRTQKQKTQILQQRNQQPQQPNIQQQQNLQKQKAIINRQENVLPRVQRQQQFKQKTITQPKVQRNIQQPKVQRNIQQPKVQRNIQQPKVQRNIQQPKVQRNIQQNRPQIQNRPAVQRSAPARAAPKAVPNVQKKKNER